MRYLILFSFLNTRILNVIVFLFKDDEEIGLVIEDIEEDVSDRIVVKWFRTKKTIHHERIVDGKLSYRAKELSIGGYYSPKAFPVLVIPMLRKICVQPSPFSIGDEVQIDMVIKIDELKMKQKDHGGYKRGMVKIKKIIMNISKHFICNMFY